MGFGINKLSRLIKKFKCGTLKSNLGYLRYRFSKDKSITLTKKGNEKWAYISYIPEALVREDDEYLNSHQNKRETKVIAQRFLENGYNVVMQDYLINSKIPDHSYDIIFGLEPNFTKCSLRNPKAKKVYYGTGAYFKYANAAVIQRTEEFNAKHNMAVAPRRLAPEDDCIEICDQILQIGSHNTIATYPEHIQPKITLINQSSNFLANNIQRSKPNRFKYLWLGSSGSILKGADLVIETFLKHSELEIDIVGTIEPEVMDAYEYGLAKAGNIHFHGYVDVNSETFLNITKDTSFFLFPSVTEGAPPGSVIVAMKLGIIPIVSRVASPDNIEELGYCLKDVTLESLESAILWSRDIEVNEIDSLQQRNRDFSSIFTLNNFSEEFDTFLKQLCIETSK